jgi:hypothetical protein
MAKARKTGGSWFGWTLGVLAAVTLMVSAPQHVLDLDEATGPVAEAAVHGHVRTVMDHGQPGHSCAAHCAAHVMSETPVTLALKPPSLLLLSWAAAADQDSRTGPASMFERPPKA